MKFGRLGLAFAALSSATGALCYHADLLNNPWCSSFRVVRFGRASNAAFWVALDYKWSLRNLQWDTEEYNSTIAKVHLRSAQCLKEMCSRNGGLFIKVGQHIGALEYLLPREYVQTFKIFHSQAPSTPFKRLLQVIEEELGQRVEDVFCELSREPLGAASLAQVHRAKLRKDGSVVAVKIQHPDVRRNGYTDMDTMDFLVACVHWLFPDFHFQWLADEVRRNLPIELDFRCEARNQDKFSVMFKHLSFVKAPKVHWDLTTSRLLTMEFCEGVKVDNKAYLEQHHINAEEVTLKLSQLYSEMIFQQGFVHCDPHPGNILMCCTTSPNHQTKHLQITLLDHGLYKSLSDEFRVNYCKLWQALINDDHDAIKHYCIELNAGELYRLLACMVTARSWAKIESGITNSSRSRAEMENIQNNIPHYLPQITQLLDSVPRQLVLILKTNDLLRGIEHTLGAAAHYTSYLTMSKSCLRALGKHEVSVATSWHTSLYWRLRTRLHILAVRTFELWLRFQTSLQHLFA